MWMFDELMSVILESILRRLELELAGLKRIGEDRYPDERKVHTRRAHYYDKNQFKTSNTKFFHLTLAPSFRVVL